MGEEEMERRGRELVRELERRRLGEVEKEEEGGMGWEGEGEGEEGEKDRMRKEEIMK